VARWRTAVGDGVDASWIGRRVWGFTGTGGGYVEQALAPVEEILPLPSGLSAVDAVTLGSSGVVSHFGLRHAHFAPGEKVLVRGAAGSIGIMTVRLAARSGAAAVAVTTSSAERGERLRHLGATHVLNRSGDGGEEAPTDLCDLALEKRTGHGLPSPRRTAPSRRLTSKPLPIHNPKDLGEPGHRAGTPSCPSGENMPPTQELTMNDVSSTQPKRRSYSTAS
jgi:hypothetical protein